MTQDINIPHNDSFIPTYFLPTNITPGPYLIPIHEIWGLDAHIKDVAKRFHELGITVLAPNLYYNTPT